MTQTINLRTLFFASFLLALITVPSARANINLNLGDGEGDNPVQDALCAVFACSSNGDLEMIDYFSSIAEDLTNIELNIGDGGRKKQRKLRGGDDQQQQKQEQLQQKEQQQQLRKSWRESSRI